MMIRREVQITYRWILNMVFFGKTYDVSPYDSQRSHPSMDLGVKWDLCVLFVQTAVKCQDCKFVWANCTVYCSNKMLQRLAVTNPKNDKMDPHGVNPTLSIFLPTPFPVAMQGLGATAPWEKDLRIPCLEIIVFTNWKTGIGLSKECYQKWYARLSCLEFIVLTKWKTFKKQKRNTRFKKITLHTSKSKSECQTGYPLDGFSRDKKLENSKL